MNVSLTPELEQLVKDKVNSGRYHSVSQVMGEALRLLDERDRVQEQRLAELKAKIQVGIEELERGEGIDGEEVFAEIEEDIRRAQAQMQQAEAAK
ncbi:type II toxin-antitoxin system ParD family antitoxin [Nostoc sp. 'Peltigera malacea cyanobiont' DB3992]|uniref:type II toxin-antitoxin system ParD family antitoxin n=1 Tax=Nostoc sp. 'Peltigera malacea cyanobiont' DB3992 TaxID=1206980 RepID=UPI000C03C84E|nr:type II toxin-antitoxin system ParD family antitoxin [Nostoc sp. 'Peltigera malacea cyanobiont' DB3992]PHM09976.1 type II toxin-antitoxin system ParD family antitoxin [Nostoc sp. 'Peltigera malacea cyanobiont' DB3992]